MDQQSHYSQILPPLLPRRSHHFAPHVARSRAEQFRCDPLPRFARDGRENFVRRATFQTLRHDRPMHLLHAIADLAERRLRALDLHFFCHPVEDVAADLETRVGRGILRVAVEFAGIRDVDSRHLQLNCQIEPRLAENPARRCNKASPLDHGVRATVRSEQPRLLRVDEGGSPPFAFLLLGNMADAARLPQRLGKFPGQPCTSWPG